MKSPFFLSLVFLLGVSQVSVAQTSVQLATEDKDATFHRLKDAPDPVKRGDLGVKRVSTLFPTQAFFGKMEADRKTQNLDNMGKHERHQFLLDNPIPVVLGPDGNYYITDHHHLARALLDGEYNYAAIEVVATYQVGDMIQFWQFMIDNNFVYPFDEDGNELTAKQLSQFLPKNCSKLIDDPYRSLAGIVRESGGFDKTDGKDFFIEFVWASFFKKHIKIEPGEEGMKRAVKEALALAHSLKAARLPGYNAKKVKPASDPFPELRDERDPRQRTEKGVVKAVKLRPTEMTYKKKEVKKKEKVISKMSKAVRHQYLLDHPIPVLIGPDGKYYVVDRHHLVKAVTNLDYTYVAVEVVGVFNGDPIGFWQFMIDNDYVYPYDEHGRKLSAEELSQMVPKDVRDMVSGEAKRRQPTWRTKPKGPTQKASCPEKTRALSA